MSGYDEIARGRVIKRMERVDAMAPAMRDLVHEYGLTLVDSFVQCGVTKPKHIRHLIETVRRGSYEIGNRTDSKSEILR